MKKNVGKMLLASGFMLSFGISVLPMHRGAVVEDLEAVDSVEALCYATRRATLKTTRENLGRIERLLNDGADPRAHDRDGYTAVHETFRRIGRLNGRLNIKVLEVFLSRDPSLINVKDSRGRTLRDWALIYFEQGCGNPEDIEYLRQAATPLISAQAITLDDGDDSDDDDGAVPGSAAANDALFDRAFRRREARTFLDCDDELPEADELFSADNDEYCVLRDAMEID